MTNEEVTNNIDTIVESENKEDNTFEDYNN
jgi:hypothetical protein